ncbi:uncharacterized protein BO72DRAFT_446016 [Aspergillus fijiensis CBS 313.89]|uniref:Uncharacterized protein n=1 Tax=Aspergillus fijiensis CBS 313.89 TaxID=1448319 RepID=A0A8G1RT67_9EURO|nr:uncharacterized protein BO72DRAFT_446016 [Aspergillus fijiensis CBS 313.89]RAK79717.1 hypothetical protein BO72DRAFT_446016 [Aspergillus fijiensis CBS 313.89]
MTKQPRLYTTKYSTIMDPSSPWLLYSYTTTTTSSSLSPQPPSPDLQNRTPTTTPLSKKPPPKQPYNSLSLYQNPCIEISA